jgi:enoyl-[acyl-carrier protein] reductase I
MLLSDWSRGITGEIVHVDGGFHAMGGPPMECVEALVEAGAGQLVTERT